MANQTESQHSSAMQQSERYPSPPRQQNGLPFYQNAPQDYEREEPQQEDAAQAALRQEEAAAAGDAQLRVSLGNALGGYGVGYQMPEQPTYAPPPDMPSQQQQGPPVNVPVAGPSDPDSAKKERTKVSRACDECRRKKIRCDAIDESGQTPCSNCNRTNARCAFSRQPMKRGPSKGYIKELAERLNSLESQVHAPGVSPHVRYELQQVQQAMGAEGYGREIIDPRVGDKRAWDVSEGLHNGQAHAGAPPNMMGMHSTSRPGPQVNTYMPPPAQMQLPLNPDQPQPFWRPGTGHIRQEPVGPPYETDDNASIMNFDWDESVIDEYYRIIHQTFPLLPSSKHRLRQRLAECPASLREACLAALDCLMRTFPTTTLAPNPSYHTAIKKVAELLARYPFDHPSQHTTSTNLVYLQTLLLMALESDNHGPATIRGQAGPSRAEWLGRAAGVAGQLEINMIRTGSRSVMEGDPDSEERLARRVWWVLFILDRWHASSTADLLKLPENSVVLLPEDQSLLGESTYHLARLSFIIGHLAAILTTTKTPSTDVMAPSNPASSLLGLTLAGEIDRFRESVESVWGSLNLVHLSYHHCHLLIKRLNPQTEPNELVGHAVKVATVLNSRATPVTPLNHHFAALAAMTLCELCDVPRTRDEALKGLDLMIEALTEGRGLAGREKGEGWDEAIRELVTAKKGRMVLPSVDGALQGLANAAVGAGTGTESGGGGGEGELDPTWLTRYGYLTALGQGVFRTK
ncbi:hypothetical protein LTR62_003476 [Meristemomyces frigidus]|uniref:Zn(2)-C6 fungal-type domain-containing protein n=1 Tax=Meristemomyces frigidus TaxID=1508187 RepID=A0AAN7TEY0_9PEZI|nr:hypothetical protein LTR62_003476 [Meristemomyces frigidus]